MVGVILSFGAGPQTREIGVEFPGLGKFLLRKAGDTHITTS